MEETLTEIKIIAEVGVNHNGSVKTACELIEKAAAAGADVVKFQIFNSDLLVKSDLDKAPYQKRNMDDGNSHHAMLKKLELCSQEYKLLLDTCKNFGVDFLASVFDMESAEFLIKELCQNTVKIGSGELTNLPLLHYLATQKCDLILSTGMACLDEIKIALGCVFHGFSKSNSSRTVENFRDLWSEAKANQEFCKKISILHCTSNYPAEIDELNINSISGLREEFGLRVGYSDHSLGSTSAVAAVALGATIIEKHLTLDKGMKGPDHLASVEPSELKQFIMDLMRAKRSLGQKHKRPTMSEEQTKHYARKGLYARRTIQVGEVLKEKDILVLRPENETPVSNYWLDRSALHCAGEKWRYSSREVL